VYKTNDEDKKMEFIVNLPPVKTYDGTEINPTKSLLQEQDTKMLLLTGYDSKKVYYMDIAKGKVISEMQVDGVNTITDLAPAEKHAEFTPNPTFMAINNKNIFKMDPRISGENKKTEGKVYAKSPEFTCITSNVDDHFATGSKSGEIRLFKQVGQNAKNLYPGLGDPILALDSTMDGKWLLATTKTYLLLLPTIIDSKNGYLTSLGKDKNIPRKLKLLPEHLLKYKIKEVNFTPARFNDLEKDHEKYIVCSTGNFLVTWTLKHVIKGDIYQYEIKYMEDKIVSNEFRYGREDSLLVTLPNEIRVQKTKKLN